MACLESFKWLDMVGMYNDKKEAVNKKIGQEGKGYTIDDLMCWVKKTGFDTECN